LYDLLAFKISVKDFLQLGFQVLILIDLQQTLKISKYFMDLQELK